MKRQKQCQKLPLEAECEQISIVLEVQGSVKKRKKVRRMMLKTLRALQRCGAEVCGSYMDCTAKRIRSFRWGSR